MGLDLSQKQYKELADLVYRLSGINLGSQKMELLRARLAKRLRVTGCPNVTSYMRSLAADDEGRELTSFLECVTTNKTDFFREPQHFDFLAEQVLPNLDKQFPGRERLFIWSAACSTGEEPYTLAMVLLENQAAWSHRGVNFLASDINSQVVEHALRGVYAKERVSTVPMALLRRYFQRGTKRWEGHVRVKPELRSLVQFRTMNLMHPFNFSHPLNIVFCRNVMIYFDKATQEQLVDKFTQAMSPGGYLFVGHSESLTGISHRLAFVRPAVYRREF